MFIKEKTIYLATLLSILIILGFVVSIVKSRDQVKSLKAKLAAIETLAENPDVKVEPTIKRIIEKIRVPVEVIKEKVVTVEVPVFTEDTVVDEMADGLRELGYYEWTRVEEIISGGSTTTHKYPELEPKPKTKNWMPTIGYNSEKYASLGVYRRIWKSVNIGIEYNFNKTIELRMGTRF